MFYKQQLQLELAVCPLWFLAELKRNEVSDFVCLVFGYEYINMDRTILQLLYGP